MMRGKLQLGRRRAHARRRDPRRGARPRLRQGQGRVDALADRARVRRDGRDALAGDEGVLRSRRRCAGRPRRSSSPARRSASRWCWAWCSPSCFFIVLPAVLTNFIAGSAAENPFRWNIVDGILRVVAFFAYIWAIGQMSDIKRVFAYHGAEHKTIHAYEHDLPLEADIIQRYETLHVRCGTSFLLMVMVVAIIVFSLTPGASHRRCRLASTNRLGILAIAILARLLLMPLVAGLAYEITVKWAGNHSENPFVKVLAVAGHADAAHDDPRAGRRHGRGRRRGDEADHRARGPRGAPREGRADVRGRALASTGEDLPIAGSCRSSPSSLGRRPRPRPRGASARRGPAPRSRDTITRFSP